jgi:sulfite reductase alpha subunit-like flavoprotein
MIHVRDNDVASSTETSLLSSMCFAHWPRRCTLWGWLKLCADIQALPEREDLRALAPYCDAENHPRGRDQREKLLALAEPSEAALYADYVLREKRTWVDVLHDFDSIRNPGSPLTLEALASLLAPIRPREFSIASSPTLELDRAKTTPGSLFGLELCVAVVEGRTPLGRRYHGLCSTYLSQLDFSDLVHLWIRPGSFHGLPTEVDSSTGRHRTPVLCVGAGTGIAPLRGLLLEREAVRDLALLDWDTKTLHLQDELDAIDRDNLLVFGCRKQSSDYYYRQEWDHLSGSGRLGVLTAFSQEQWHKIYVQQVLRRANHDSRLLVRHAVERDGAIYIAGGPKMARAVKDEIIEELARELGGDQKQAKQLITRLQRLGLYSIEAWS